VGVSSVEKLCRVALAAALAWFGLGVGVEFEMGSVRVGLR